MHSVRFLYQVDEIFLYKVIGRKNRAHKLALVADRSGVGQAPRHPFFFYPRIADRFPVFYALESLDVGHAAANSDCSRDDVSVTVGDEQVVGVHVANLALDNALQNLDVVGAQAACGAV